MADNFEELYGEAGDAAADVTSQPEATQAAAVAAVGDGDDEFLLLYGEAALEDGELRRRLRLRRFQAFRGLSRGLPLSNSQSLCSWPANVCS